MDKIQVSYTVCVIIGTSDGCGVPGRQGYKQLQQQDTTVGRKANNTTDCVAFTGLRFQHYQASEQPGSFIRHQFSCRSGSKCGHSVNSLPHRETTAVTTNMAEKVTFQIVYTKILYTRYSRDYYVRLRKIPVHRSDNLQPYYPYTRTNV